MKDRTHLLPHSPTPELDLRLLREYAAGDEALLETYIARRAKGEPVAQILGAKGFWTLDLRVTRDVLTPRPDTETILDTLLRHRPERTLPYRILDLGTGSGCLILAALSEYPNATGLGVDVSEAALKVARENAALLIPPACGGDKGGVKHGNDSPTAPLSDANNASQATLPPPQAGEARSRLALLLSDWCAAIPEGEMFDIILSNPPYIPTAEIASLAPDVREYEPHLALDGGPDGLDCYRTLANQLKPRMVEGAIALCEVGAPQAHDVAAILERHGWRVIDIAKDLAGIERVVVFTPA